MTSIHATASVNVKATLAAWMQTNLALVDRPANLDAYTVEMNIPQEGIATPSYSITHIDAGRMSRYQGNAASATLKGYYALGILDVSAWVSRVQVNWQAQLRWMVSAAERVVIGQEHGAIEIQDYITDPSSPTDTEFRITLLDMAIPQLVIPNETFNPNPNIERVRMVINYQWIIRSA